MKFRIMLVLFLPAFSFAKDLQPCGVVSIEQVIVGPRHGSLLNLSNNSCGNSGYACIDLEGEYSSKEKGKAAYSFALAAHMANRNIHVTVDLDAKPLSCGGNYPVVEDIRTN